MLPSLQQILSPTSSTFISTLLIQSLLTVCLVNMLTLTFRMACFPLLCSVPISPCNLCINYAPPVSVSFATPADVQTLSFFQFRPFVPAPSTHSSVLFITENCLLVLTTFCCAISLDLFIPLPNMTFISLSWLSQIISSYLQRSFFLVYWVTSLFSLSSARNPAWKIRSTGISKDTQLTPGFYSKS